VVELGAPGSADGAASAEGRARVAVETVSLAPRRDVRIVDGLLADLVDRAHADTRPDDYILAVVRDTSALIDPLGRLREVYPNTLQIERPELERERGAREHPVDILERGDAELFADFFAYVTGEPLDAAQATAFAETLDGLLHRDREAAP
jgi:exonuclease SbcD